jgi:dimeric dUTPase (all-alpha-NTP-PPase superfamily)
VELDLKEIIEAQQILDKAVHQRHNVTYPKILEELKLALFVELGELANEVRCFKFWSIKNSSERKVILEEYVDGIHFISSLSIAHDVNSRFILNDNTSILNKKNLTIAFNRLFRSMEILNTPDGIKE